MRLDQEKRLLKRPRGCKASGGREKPSLPLQRGKRFARGCKEVGKEKKPTLPLQRKKRPAPSSDEGKTSSRSESEESDEEKKEPKKRRIGDEVLRDEITGYEGDSEFV